MEKLYSALEFVSMEDMVDHLEQKKIMMAFEEPIRLIDLFAQIDKCLMRKYQQQAIECILPSRPFPPSPQITPIKPHVNVRFYPSFKNHRVLEWQTCNRV